MDKETLKRRKRSNLSLKVLRAMLLPLVATYVAWLAMMGHELARWPGAAFVVVLGLGYPFVINASLIAYDTKPFPADDSRQPVADKGVPT